MTAYAQWTRSGIWHTLDALGNALCGLYAPPWVRVELVWHVPATAELCAACELCKRAVGLAGGEDVADKTMTNTKLADALLCDYQHCDGDALEQTADRLREYGDVTPRDVAAMQIAISNKLYPSLWLSDTGWRATHPNSGGISFLHDTLPDAVEYALGIEPGTLTVEKAKEVCGG